MDTEGWPYDICHFIRWTWPSSDLGICSGGRDAGINPLQMPRDNCVVKFWGSQSYLWISIALGSVPLNSALFKGQLYWEGTEARTGEVMTGDEGGDLVFVHGVRGGLSEEGHWNWDGSHARRRRRDMLSRRNSLGGRREVKEGVSGTKVRLVGRSGTITRGLRGRQKELGFCLKLRKNHWRILSRDDQVWFKF